MTISSFARVLCPVLALALAACGSSSNSSGGGPKVCGSTGSGNGTCTSAEVSAYGTCVQTACDTEYKTCLGAGYKSGTYTGVCATYVQCHDKCACGDTACQAACGIPAGDCTACLLSVATCSATCTVPACYSATGAGGKSGGAGGMSGGGGASGTGACASVLACCNRATAASKPTCMATYNSIVQLGDSYCALGLPDFEATYCGEGTGVGGSTGTGKACADLQACCAGSTDKATCTTTYNGLMPLNENTCTIALPSFQTLYCPATGSNGTCADLLNCCNRATVAQLKTVCMTAYTQLLSSGDAVCGLELASLKSSVCP